MAQPQRQADVHQDEFCPPNKRYDLMDANKKIDLNNPLFPNESKIMANILQNHPLRFSIAASSSVPWIYLGKFWHTLKEDGSLYRPHVYNNHERFVAAPKFSEMVPFFLNDLGFTLELRTPSTSRKLVSYNNDKHLARCLHDVLPHEPLVMINRLCR
ncbi:hypothetical protein Tco_0462800 [Tanacetum coccineum]